MFVQQIHANGVYVGPNKVKKAGTNEIVTGESSETERAREARHGQI